MWAADIFPIVGNVGRGGGLHDTDRRRLADRVRASEAFRALCGLWLDLNFSHCGWGTLHPSIVGVAALGEPPMRPNSKVILPYEPGYTGHWEMKKRRKETKESLRQREQEVRDRLNSPSIVPGHGMSGTTKLQDMRVWMARRSINQLVRIQRGLPRSLLN